MLRKIFSFPAPFLEVFPKVWLVLFVLLVGADLASKKVVTDNLNFNLGRHQRASAVSMTPAETDGTQQIEILGEDGKLIKFSLVFNDRFVFGLGPSAPVLGFFLTVFATLFLILYRWHHPRLGYQVAWLFVFSGAFGNLIDKMFVKNLETREWVFSLTPQPGHVSGVVDFVECIWFGWDAVRDIFLVNMLSMERWPTFNLADSLIVVGIVLLLLSMREETATSTEEAGKTADSRA